MQEKKKERERERIYIEIMKIIWRAAQNRVPSLYKKKKEKKKKKKKKRGRDKIAD